MLTSLAQIQSGVLGFAHQLEKEELFARPPIRTDVGVFTATNSAEKGVIRNRPEESAQIPLFDDDDEEPDSEEDEDAAEQNGKAILRLEQTLKEAKSDAAKQEKRAAVAELHALHKEATELHQQDSIRSKRLEQERDTLRDTVRRHEEQLHRANQALAVWEEAGAEFMTLTATNTTLQQENAALRCGRKWNGCDRCLRTWTR